MFCVYHLWFSFTIMSTQYLYTIGHELYEENWQEWVCICRHVNTPHPEPSSSLSSCSCSGPMRPQPAESRSAASAQEATYYYAKLWASLQDMWKLFSIYHRTWIKRTRASIMFIFDSICLPLIPAVLLPKTKVIRRLVTLPSPLPSYQVSGRGREESNKPIATSSIRGALNLLIFWCELVWPKRQSLWTVFGWWTVRQPAKWQGRRQ